VERAISVCVSSRLALLAPDTSSTVDCGVVLAIIDEMGRKRQSHGSSDSGSARGPHAAEARGGRSSGQQRYQRSGLLVSRSLATRCICASFQAGIVWSIVEISFDDMGIESSEPPPYVASTTVLILWLAERLGGACSQSTEVGAATLAAATVRRIVQVLQSHTKAIKWFQDHAKVEHMSFQLGTDLTVDSAAISPRTRSVSGAGPSSPREEMLSGKAGMFAEATAAGLGPNIMTGIRVLPIEALTGAVLRGVFVSLLATQRAMVDYRSAASDDGKSAVAGIVRSSAQEL